jgi:hypothetical protein
VKSFDLPFSNKSPEELLEDAQEEEQEKRPRQYAEDIIRNFDAPLRRAECDRIVPKHLRKMVHVYLDRAAVIAKALRRK